MVIEFMLKGWRKPMQLHYAESEKNHLVWFNATRAIISQSIYEERDIEYIKEVIKE